MFSLQNAKVQHVIKFSAPTNGETITSETIDTMGYDDVLLTICATTSNNATNNPSTLKVQESDTDVASNYADIAALVGDGASGFTIPNSPTATTTAPFAMIHIRTAYRKRYLRALFTPLTTQTVSATAILGRASQSPVGTTAQNAAVVVTA